MSRTGTLAFFAAAIAASAQSAATFEWKGSIQPGQTVEIRNVIGDIRADAAPGPDAEISVRIVGSRPDPNTVRIDVVPHDGGVLLCTIYEGLSNPEHCTPGLTPSVTLSNSDIRVTYTVRVPADVTFAPRTVNGSVFADLPASAISAATVNGRIVLSTGKPADAHTVNGSVVASLANIDWEGLREFGSVNGAVDVEIADSSRASARASIIWGILVNDFGIPIQKNLVGSTFSGDINGGGSSLVLRTVNGSIHLRRAPAQ